MIAEVFRKNGINLVYGASGLGKTVSSVKAINSNGIKPILLDFDNNMSPEKNNCYRYVILQEKLKNNPSQALWYVQSSSCYANNYNLFLKIK